MGHTSHLRALPCVLCGERTITRWDALKGGARSDLNRRPVCPPCTERLQQARRSA